MSLKRVLLAFVSHAPEIGYVQSMHSMAAFLLLAGLDERTRLVPGDDDERNRSGIL